MAGKRQPFALWAIAIAFVLGAVSIGSLIVAAARGAEKSATRFAVSNCNYQSGQGCPAPPGPGTCHLNGKAQDPGCTPGVLNPAVTQRTIKGTICRAGWTSRIRPPESYTEPLKLKLMKAYGYGGSSPSGFELDHLISLELGGAPSDERNLWPESHKNSYNKDGLENSLRSQVCSHSISLAKAQWRIVHWPKFVRRGRKGGGGGGSLDVNCSDFATQEQAQAWFNQHGGSPSNDVGGLDADHDGIACESLPR
jgi:excalibur calcium-binding domain-containing protein